MCFGGWEQSEEGRQSPGWNEKGGSQSFKDDTMSSLPPYSTFRTDNKVGNRTMMRNQLSERVDGALFLPASLLCTMRNEKMVLVQVTLLGIFRGKLRSSCRYKYQLRLPLEGSFADLN